MLNHLHQVAVFALSLTLCFWSVGGLTVSGVWDPNSRFLQVVSRFGFLKSDVHHKDKTDGYVFGNVLSIPSVKSKVSHNHSMATLLLVDRGTFGRMLGDDKEVDKLRPDCPRIMSQVSQTAFDEKCNNNTTKTKDTMRFLPCPTDKGKLCPGSSRLSNDSIVPGSQVTFLVSDQKQPTFWYLVFIACHRNASCGWERVPTNETTVYRYDINLVNGRPDKASTSLLTHHFSYEEQDLILYMVMVALYSSLVACQVYAVLKQRHRNLLVFLFTTSLFMQVLSFFFSTIHKILFAQNGRGSTSLSIVSDVLRIVSLGLFILFVLIIAKGWPMTRSEVSGKPLLLLVWVSYIVIELVLFVWVKRSLDVVTEVDEYHTLPGWISLLFRILIMMWFLCELRSTMMLEQNQMRLRFYLHFGAGVMVWFVHLPIVAIIGLQISLMWRYKLILGFSSAANFLSFAIVTHFMWPTKMSYRFLTHPSDAGDFTQEELEDYEQDPTESFGYYNNPNYTQSNGHGRFNFQSHLKSSHIKA